MVSKSKIGKIQLVIGIIILVIGILGGIYSTNRFMDDLVWNVNLDLGGVMIASFILSMMSTSIILIILSLLFITQGLVNKSGNQNVC